MPSLAELTPLTEQAFQKQICQLAELYHWEWAHCRAGRTIDSWRTPMSGPLGQGFPDLILVRNGRLIFMEVKRAGGKLSPHQERVMAVLSKVAEAYTVWPKDWAFIERELAA